MLSYNFLPLGLIPTTNASCMKKGSAKESRQEYNIDNFDQFGKDHLLHLRCTKEAR